MWETLENKLDELEEKREQLIERIKTLDAQIALVKDLLSNCEDEDEE